jgi:cyclopropane-fatty-acyl-phospholipid synthase
MNWIYKKILLSFFKDKKLNGAIKISFGDENYEFGTSQDSVNIKVLKKEFFRRVIHYGDAGFGESYFLGEFETDDLKKLLMWFIENKEAMPGFNKKFLLFEWAKIALRFAHFRRKNTKRGSKKNIKEHYDISNDFFKLWLDDTMTYSSAVFEGEMSLKQAQENKYYRICEKIGLNNSDHILEIGSGWGGFAIYAAKKYGCKITAITISRAQYEYAKKRIESEKLEEQIEILIKDYRDLKGEYDKIVSIEMMEAIGHKYVPIFINICSSLLKNKGKICFQCITYPDKDYHNYLKNSNYIKKYIFPGGELLSLDQITKASEKENLSITQVEKIGLHYAKTLDKWKKNMESQKEEIFNLGFGEEFYKKWLYYFIYCSVGFETSYLDDVQITLEKQ